MELFLEQGDEVLRGRGGLRDSAVAIRLEEEYRDYICRFCGPYSLAENTKMIAE